MKGVIIRATQVSDYQDIHELLACPGVVRNTLQLPYVSLDQHKKRLEELRPGEHLLAAEVDGKVVDQLSLACLRYRRSHMGQIFMAVHDDYQNRGIGTALMAAAIDLADNWFNLKRLELQVFTDNAPAIHLYEKFGFIIEGTHKADTFREGKYVSTYSMARVR
jgi:L-phenylalanine/L-methionine N-acetyltransferase